MPRFNRKKTMKRRVSRKKTQRRRRVHRGGFAALSEAFQTSGMKPTYTFQPTKMNFTQTTTTPATTSTTATTTRTMSPIQERNLKIETALANLKNPTINDLKQFIGKAATPMDNVTRDIQNMAKGSLSSNPAEVKRSINNLLYNCTADGRNCLLRPY
jgi:hypothetical protein